MVVTATQKNAIEEVIQILLNATAPRSKRALSGMFLELVDRESWPEYYEVIPEPRCINGVKENVEKNRYKDPLEAYNDLNLVFLNALYYNEEGSQIAKDANTLKEMLDTEWRQRSVLPVPRTSPPPASAQRKNESAAPQAPAPTPVPAPEAGPQAPGTPKGRPTAVTAAIEPTSPERPITPEMDVDIGGSPEPEGLMQDTARDGESEEIVRQLERGLPKWEGFADVGWAEHIPEDRYLDIVLAISGHQDSQGNRVASSLDTLPEETAISDLSFNTPLSLTLIENRARTGYYKSSKAFDKEMSQFFLKARRHYEPGSEAYGNVLLLQRLYHALTSSNPPSGPPFASSTNFASLRAGPGTAKPLHTADTEGVPGVTTFRVSNKDRTFVDEVHFKGWTIKLADWLHLSNPDDPSRPIITQVFKCWLSDEPSKKGQPWVTVCWYYRPEQTFHPAQRQFWEREVFKTSHFADHPLEDVVEKIACQFTARHIRGRPRPPFWYPGWPLYVCDSRYNDRERIFVKIKNWNSCVPEEVRKSTEFMPIYPFERSVFPRRFASPFLSGKNIKAPGGIGDVIEKGEGEKIEGGGTGRRRPRRAPAGATTSTGKPEHTDRIGPSKGLYVGAPANAQISTAPTTQYQTQPPSQFYGRAPPMQPRSDGDRSIVAAAGGVAALGANVEMEELPQETAKHFDRDPETNQVLWFATPPVDIAHPPGPQYSLAYQNYLAKKRKQTTGGGDAMDVDERDTDVRKKTKVQPTATETIDALLSEHEFQ